MRLIEINANINLSNSKCSRACRLSDIVHLSAPVVDLPSGKMGMVAGKRGAKCWGKCLGNGSGTDVCLRFYCLTRVINILAYCRQYFKSASLDLYIQLPRRFSLIIKHYTATYVVFFSPVFIVSSGRALFVLPLLLLC